MKILIINNDYAIEKHIAGFKSTEATGMLEISDMKHARYFIDNFKGQNNYMDALPFDEEVSFTVYHEFKGKLIEDKLVKPKNWIPFY